MAMTMLDTARAVQAGENWPDGLATKIDLAEAKADILKWMFGAIGFQTMAILGGVALLLRLGS
jgi:hypothetical protein